MFSRDGILVSGLNTRISSTIISTLCLFIQSTELGHGTDCSCGFLLFRHIKLLSHGQTITIIMTEQYWDIIIA